MTIVSEIIEMASGEAGQQGGAVSEAARQELEGLLGLMLSDCDDISGGVISASDGHAIAERLQSGLDKHRFAAMSSALLALSDNVARETHDGGVKNVLIQSDSGNVLILHAGNQRLLTVFCRANANLGMSLSHASKCAAEIAELNLNMDT